jgi:hypothetical protein
MGEEECELKEMKGSQMKAGENGCGKKNES